MSPITIPQEELLIALEDGSDTHSWFLDLETGEILFAVNDPLYGGEDEEQEVRERIEAAPERYRWIPRMPSHEAFHMMVSFVDELPASHARARLGRALSLRHPFRQFRDTLAEYPEEREVWFAFRTEHLLCYAMRWLDEEGIDADVVPFTPVHQEVEASA